MATAQSPQGVPQQMQPTLLSAPEGARQLKNDIITAARTVSAVREHFRSIGSLLSASEAEPGLKGAKESWTSLDDLYFQVIGESKTLASELSAHAEAFNRVLEAAVGTYPISMSKKIIDNHINDGKRFEDKGHVVRNKLRELSEGLDNFAQGNFEVFFEPEPIEYDAPPPELVEKVEVEKEPAAGRRIFGFIKFPPARTFVPGFNGKQAENAAVTKNPPTDRKGKGGRGSKGNELESQVPATPDTDIQGRFNGINMQGVTQAASSQLRSSIEPSTFGRSQFPTTVAFSDANAPTEQNKQIEKKKSKTLDAQPQVQVFPTAGTEQTNPSPVLVQTGTIDSLRDQRNKQAGTDPVKPQTAPRLENVKEPEPVVITSNSEDRQKTYAASNKNISRSSTAVIEEVKSFGEDVQAAMAEALGDKQETLTLNNPAALLSNSPDSQLIEKSDGRELQGIVSTEAKIPGDSCDDKLRGPGSTTSDVQKHPEPLNNGVVTRAENPGDGVNVKPAIISPQNVPQSDTVRSPEEQAKAVGQTSTATIDTGANHQQPSIQPNGTEKQKHRQDSLAAENKQLSTTGQDGRVVEQVSRPVPVTPETKTAQTPHEPGVGERGADNSPPKPTRKDTIPKYSPPEAQKGADGSLPQILSQCQQLSSTHRQGISESLAAFENFRKSLESAALDIQRWLDLNSHTIENAPHIIRAYMDAKRNRTSVFADVSAALAQYGRLTISP